MNSIYKAYFAFDQFLVDRANEAVKAWNWTTGRTRADLANILHTTGWIMANMSFKEKMIKAVAILPTAVVISRSYVINKINDENDRRIASGESMLLHKEIQNKMYRETGTVFAGLGIVVNTSLPGDIYADGMFSIAASNYVMRADYQAPRKDCVRRGLEKLTEVVKTQQPVHEVAK